MEVPALAPQPTHPSGTSAASALHGTARASHEDDAALLRQVATHDSQAFDTLYARYAPRLRGYLARLLSHQELVDEVLNDVMLVLWQRASYCPPSVPLAAWLCGIARNKARKAWARTSSPVTTPITHDEINPDDPEDIMLRQEYGYTLTRALDTLPRYERTALELLMYQGYSHQEIAAVTGDPVSTVRTRVSRARQRLRARVAGTL